MPIHVRTRALLLLALLVPILAICAEAASGSVTHRIGGCDYFIVATAKGYDVLEWYGGHDPDEDDVLIGPYETYGMHTVYDDTADEEIQVWVEEYGLSKEDALEKLVDECQ